MAVASKIDKERGGSLQLFTPSDAFDRIQTYQTFADLNFDVKPEAS